MVFQWFSMVANHWSEDGMITIHRSGLSHTERESDPCVILYTVCYSTHCVVLHKMCNFPHSVLFKCVLLFSLTKLQFDKKILHLFFSQHVSRTSLLFTWRFLKEWNISTNKECRYLLSPESESGVKRFTSFGLKNRTPSGISPPRTSLLHRLWVPPYWAWLLSSSSAPWTPFLQAGARSWRKRRGLANPPSHLV